jgi:membrane associated rhomboid family serine protease
MELSGTPAAFITMAVTVLASFWAFSSPGAFKAMALSPYRIAREGTWYQTVTSGLIHADLGHLFFNMFTLFFFGPPLERYLGATGFVAVYLGSMVAGSLLAVLRHRDEPDYRAVGASGAISGVLFGFILFQPLTRIYIFLIPFGIPAFLFAVGYVLISIFGMRTRMGRIGHDAHLGGALAGIVLTIILYPKVVGIFLSHFG